MAIPHATGVGGPPMPSEVVVASGGGAVVVVTLAAALGRLSRTGATQAMPTPTAPCFRRVRRSGPSRGARGGIGSATVTSILLVGRGQADGDRRSPDPPGESHATGNNVDRTDGRGQPADRPIAAVSDRRMAGG